MLYMRVAGQLPLVVALPLGGAYCIRAKMVVLRGRRGRAEAAAHVPTAVAVQPVDGSHGEIRMVARLCLGSHLLVQPLSS